jgi:hypothetical protein
MRRWLMAGAALAFPVIGAMAYAGTAAAGAGPATAATGVTCTKLTGLVNTMNDTAKITLSGCNDTANTGGGGKTSGSEGATTGTITWNGGKGTTKLDDIVTTTPTGTCPSTDLEEMTTGNVSGGTGKAKASIKKGWVNTSYVCYNPSNNKLTLAPGTEYTIAPASSS